MRALPGLRRPEEVEAHCPIDDWTFAPQFTDGRCPLCGWRPEGKRVEPPRLSRVDWFWPSMTLMLVLSVVMAILVIVAYTR